jgi:hypothetical protein
MSTLKLWLRDWPLGLIIVPTIITLILSLFLSIILLSITGWLTVGFGLMAIQVSLAGWPTDRLSEITTILLAVVAPLQVIILVKLAWKIAGGENRLIILYAVWLIWPFTPTVAKLTSELFVDLIGKNYLFYSLFAWRYEMVWITLPIAVVIARRLLSAPQEDRR